MSKVERIEHDVQALSPAELAAFRKWFREFDAEEWDRQLEEDAKAGRLDTFADAALKAFKSGKCSEGRGTKGSGVFLRNPFPSGPTARSQSAN